MTGVTLSDTEPLYVAYDDMDEDDVSTNVSDVVDEYVRLSVASGMPKLRGAIDWNDLTAHEAWAVTLVGAGFSVRAIVDTSPLDEEATMTLLTHLVRSRIIAVTS